MKLDKFIVRGIFAASSLAVVAMLSGCGTTGQQVESEVAEAVAQQVNDVPEAFGEAAGQAAPILVGWVDEFHDETLKSLVLEAQENNKNLAAAAANVNRAQALAAQAGAALAPTANLVAGDQRSGSPSSEIASASGQSVGLQVSWEADLWGRLSAGERSATESFRAVQADYQYAQDSLAAATTSAYITSIEAKLQAAVAKDSVSILTETLRIVQVRYDNGMGDAQDVALSKSDLAAARESLITIEGSYRDSVRALEILLGRYPSAETELPENLPVLPAAPPVGLPSELLERRPDVVAADRRVAAAFNNTEQAKAARLPSLGLTGSFGGSSDALSSLLDPANLAWQAGTSLLVPIFDGGARKQEVKVATAEQEQALAAYGVTAQTAFSEVESALDQGTVLANRNVELAEVATESAEAFRISQLRYKEGEAELLDTLTIQRRVNAANSSLATIQRLQLQQRIDLYLALGGDWES